MKLSETDVKTKFITPAIKKAGWNIHSQMREEVTDHRFDNFFPGHYGYDGPYIWIDEMHGALDGSETITVTGSINAMATLMSSKDGVDIDNTSGFKAIFDRSVDDDGEVELSLNELELELGDWYENGPDE